MTLRYGLLVEVVVMAFETVRGNKMRSFLTVLGVVIGITSIVGMTALIRGFDQSLRDLIAQACPDIVYLQRFGVASFANGTEFSKLLKRPDLTISDARALETQTSDARSTSTSSSAPARPGHAAPRLLPQSEDQEPRRLRHRRILRRRHPAAGAAGTVSQRHRHPVPPQRPVLGNTAYKLLFEASGVDPLGKFVRIGTERFEVLGVFDKRPSPGGFGVGQDDFVVVPHTTYTRASACASAASVRTGSITNV